jgi:hypothetical protein
MKTAKILKRLAAFAPEIIGQTAKPGPHCVLSSAVGQMVLARLGVEAEPFAAEVNICNAAWIAWAQDDYAGGPEAREARGAYLISNSPNWDGPSLPSLNPPTSAAWDGHLALRVGKVLVDLDFGAFSRPTKGLRLPPVMVAPLREDGTVRGVCQMGQSRAYVQYAPLVAPYADDYLTAKDWTLRDRYSDQVHAIAGRIILGR